MGNVAQILLQDIPEKTVKSLNFSRKALIHRFLVQIRPSVFSRPHRNPQSVTRNIELELQQTVQISWAGFLWKGYKEDNHNISLVFIAQQYKITIQCHLMGCKCVLFRLEPQKHQCVS